MESRPAIGDAHPPQHEKRPDAVNRQNLAAKAFFDRNGQRSTEKHLADRAHTPSQREELLW